VKWRGALLGLLTLAFACTRPSRPAGPIAWLHDEAQGFSESQRTGKPILVNASAEWCTACILLDRNTWSDGRVQREVTERFVPLFIDFSVEGPKTDAQRETYGVVGLPTLLLCRPPGCSASASHRSIGYLGPSEMLAFLTSP
jgi:thiol:disulfide interchange protein DsbD